MARTVSAQSAMHAMYLLMRLDERAPAVEHHQPTLAHKLLDRSPDRVSAHAILLR